ncbi:MAG: hypothetical protein KF802_06630 [Bdellovibrionaceae bacterium]|nr:hypothetical protein [Pseudobdellovibrionaceae bacterium]MBX3034418.1 hypothetical protein [Pseudobdellovibrionaceae bacterium]
MKHVLLLLILSVSVAARAASGDFLPKNLTAGDRQKALEILGFGAQVKLLSSPVPLGGQQGFEVGLSSEYIPVEDIGGLGAKSSAQGEYNYLAINLGKGLAYNVDTFVQFTPIPQSEGSFGYGAQLRWGFFELPRFPAVLSLVIHGGGMNFSNLLSTRTTGADLVMTVAMDDIALYFGGGTARTIGTFAGGARGITAEGDSREEDMTGVHTVFGLAFNMEKLFVAFEVNRVAQSAYGGRIGYRF